MWLTKAETWTLAERLGGEVLVELIVEETHSCYRGERGMRHDWGYGCGELPCLRAPRQRLRAMAADQGGMPRRRQAECHSRQFPTLRQQDVQIAFMWVARGCVQQPQ